MKLVTNKNLIEKNLFVLLKLMLIASSVVAAFHFIYFYITPWVYSKNLIYPKNYLTPWMERHTESRDGIEIYVLYVLMFIQTAVSATLFWIVKYLRNKFLERFLLLAAFIYTCYFFSGIVFTPPSGVFIQYDIDSFLLSLILGILILILLKLNEGFPKSVATFLVLLVLIPFCFIATQPISSFNYVYIFGPAQKLFHGIDFQSIYFQYEFFISFIALLWMKLGLPLTEFQIVGQLSNFAAILAAFLIARSIFRNSALSILMLIALIIVKIASAPWDPVYVFQITALRLDLWIILIAIIYFYGPNHWYLPATLGVLMLVHGNFGFIYTLGYIQLILTLNVIKIADSGDKKLSYLFRRDNLVYPATIILYLLICFIVSRLVFQKNLDSIALYQKIGIGFIPISQSSFFWIVPIFVSMMFILLLNLRKNISSKYIAIGFSFLYFFIGNCIYFFGRSHELVLFSISIPLIFLLFFTLDLIDRYISIEACEKISAVSKNLALIFGVVFILLASYKCSDQIVINLKLKLDHAIKLQIHQGDPFSEDRLEAIRILDEVDKIIDSNHKIKFITDKPDKEFAFYDLVPRNEVWFYPLHAWIFLDDLIQYSQTQIDNETYLLIDKELMESKFNDRLNNVGFRYVTMDGKYILIAKNPPM